MLLYEFFIGTFVTLAFGWVYDLLGYVHDNFGLIIKSFVDNSQIIRARIALASLTGTFK